MSCKDGSRYLALISQSLFIESDDYKHVPGIALSGFIEPYGLCVRYVNVKI